MFFIDRNIVFCYNIETNKCLVDMVDFVVAGVITHCGGAYMACEYAYKRKKPILSVIDGWEII